MVFVLRVVLEINHDLLNTDEDVNISLVVFLFICDIVGMVVVEMMIISVDLILVIDKIKIGGIF